VTSYITHQSCTTGSAAAKTQRPRLRHQPSLFQQLSYCQLEDQEAILVTSHPDFTASAGQREVETLRIKRHHAICAVLGKGATQQNRSDHSYLSVLFIFSPIMDPER
jgi:hypothetical protein